MKKCIKGVLLGIVFVIFSVNFVFAQEFTHVIINSENWKDVYSGMHYANLDGVGSDFLVSTGHGPILLNDIKKENDIRVITSKSIPYVFNYPGTIQREGFADVDEISVDDANLELIGELEDISNFVVVGDSYGYNAVAVVPYAFKTRSWVFLANRFNAFEIESILNKRNVENVLIYGYVDREVREVLEKYSPKIIDSGDKFEDNIEIVKKYLEINPTEQVVLTNGDFLEKEIMSGTEPVLFTGRSNVPDKIRDYLKNSDITIGVLVGNELVGAATNIKRTTGISVMVKFARGARSQNKGIAAVEGLDLFPIPTPSLKLSIHSIKYNRVTGQLEITYKSDSNVPAYLIGTITILSDSGQVKVGDLEPIFIAPGDFKTIIYPLNLTSLENLQGKVYVLFGETPSSLDRLLEQTLEIGVIDVIDKCEIEILGIRYNQQKKVFFVKTKNLGDMDCWVDIELKDVFIDGINRMLGTEGSTRVPAKKTKNIRISADLNEADLERNPFVEVIAYFGEREDSLVKVFKGRFELKIEMLSALTYAIIALILIIVALIILIISIKRKEEEEEG